MDALQQLDAQAKQEKHNWMPKPDVSDVFSAYCRGLLLRPHGATSLCSAVFGRGRERQRAGVCRHLPASEYLRALLPAKSGRGAADQPSP